MKNVVWTAVLAALALIAALAVALAWPDDRDLALILAVVSVSLSIMAIQEKR